MDSIVVSEVSKSYTDAKGDSFQALNCVSFHWKKGENLAIIGESGSGKSTLARLLIGIEKPSSGTIFIDGENISKWSFGRWRRARCHIQAVFQDAAGTMNPAYSVYRNMTETLKNLTDIKPAQRKERITELMQMTSMNPRLLDVPVRQLSGGEQRRLALLRALSIRPDYLILDEVTSGLDIISAGEVLSLLEDYHKKCGCSYLLITHSMQTAYRLADRIIVMQEGEMIKNGSKKLQCNVSQYKLS